jgi:hypothetical protein
MRARYRHEQQVTVGVDTFVVEHDYLHSAPMSYMARSDAYHRQQGDRPLTARQLRQLERMARLNRRVSVQWVTR